LPFRENAGRVNLTGEPDGADKLDLTGSDGGQPDSKSRGDALFQASVCGRKTPADFQTVPILTNG